LIWIPLRLLNENGVEANPFRERRALGERCRIERRVGFAEPGVEFAERKEGFDEHGDSVADQHTE
jgi:hypothetical protein